MFSFLKPKKKAVELPHKVLIDSLQLMFYNEDLHSIMYNSESKITLINVYSDNISDLVNKAYRDELGTKLSAINLYNYLYKVEVDRLKVLLQRLIEACSNDVIFGKINNHVKNDIEELVGAYLLLKGKP